MQKTLTDICRYLRNWEFDYEPQKCIGEITITGGELSIGGKAIVPKNGQYIRVVGSVFNDGIHLYPDPEMPEETFDGAVWLLAIPQEIIDLAEDIDAWKEKYETINSPALSPYNSESFSGYSYSKSTVTGEAVMYGTTGWQGAFAGRLAPWRKL